MPRNPWGHYRRRSTTSSFEFEEKDGVKLLKEFSNSTATAIRIEAPIIDLELFNARSFVERDAKASGEPIITSVKNRFPKLANWFYDDELTQAVSDKQRSVRQWVNQIMSNRLNMPEGTIERYRRQRRPQKSRD
jgi:hypothetical protein